MKKAVSGFVDIQVHQYSIDTGNWRGGFDSKMFHG